MARWIVVPMMSWRSTEPTDHNEPDISRPLSEPDRSDGPSVPKAVSDAIVDIATHAWRARRWTESRDEGTSHAEARRAQRALDGIVDALTRLGVEIKDHTGIPFDYGLPLRVVATQPTEGIEREVVIETLKPSILWKGNLVQIGEVIVATMTNPGGAHD